MPAVTSVHVPYASYLRVYEPLGAFPEPERSHWARYATGERAPGAQEELRRSLADLLPTPPVAVPVHESGDAFVTEVDGVVCVCPWRTRLRGWLALEELTRTLPPPLLDAVLPPVVRIQATSDYERWRDRNPDARPWIRSAVWQVPVGWFALFSDEERLYGNESPAPGEGGADPDGAGAPVLRYRTPMVQARRRLARALKTLRETLDEAPMIEGLIEVGRWLEEFHPRSLVELDYGGLVHAMPRERLADDHSAADVTAAVAALRDGDMEAAGAAYGRLVARWSAVRNRQHAS
ncbi:hypothetical protein AB0O07_32910 [Streptomyces sp. NPDC093085]|uniref:hypothetical protein n=1 Tax=Streptomyces sp. NPDC093085 TaxID=3155068 RepID=UPI0034244F8F